MPREVQPSLSDGQLRHHRYWTGPVLLGVQYGWAVATAAGSFGEPTFTGYGATMAEAEAALAETLR